MKVLGPAREALSEQDICPPGGRSSQSGRQECGRAHGRAHKDLPRIGVLGLIMASPRVS